MSFVVVTPPDTEPLTLAQAKAHLEVTHNGDDTLITLLIGMARQWVETICERAIMPQTWRLNMDGFPYLVELPGGLVRQVDSLSYTSFAGESETLDVAGLQKDLDRQPARLMPALGSSWPQTAAVLNAVRVTYQVGYANAAAVPKDLLAGIYLVIGDLYANREAQQDMQLYENVTVDRLLWPYRRVIL